MRYTVSSTPHIRSNDTTQNIMVDVLIALTPAACAGVYIFGIRAALVLALSISSCILFEGLYQRLLKRPVTVLDCSAAVTGVLLAMNLPVTVPFWLPIVGALVAIVITKQLFGGLGQNFMNPALAGRAFLLAAYPQSMTHWSAQVDAVSTPTPLALLKTGQFAPTTADYINALIGKTGGCPGETCAIALLLGALYLLYRGVISWRIPLSYLLTFGLLTFVLGRQGQPLFTGYPLYEMLCGGLLLGAFFMATDYSTSPITPLGQLIMGAGCGLLTVVIRYYGTYPEGVSYSILLMNLAVPLIDRFTKPRVFGVRNTISQLKSR